MWPFFWERLRREDPVHYTADSLFGPYWSITRYHDIMSIETNHGVFSSARGISLFDQADDFQLPMFIAMDPPKHDAQRSCGRSRKYSPHQSCRFWSSPIASGRERSSTSCSIGETFDWVDRVWIELTTRLPSRLFGFP